MRHAEPRFLMLMATVVGALLAAGCDRAGPDVAPGGGGPVEVTWMVAVGPDRAMYEELVGMFHAQQDRVRVRFMWVPGSQYQIKLKTLIAARQAPDVFWTSDAWMAYELPFLADLTPFVQRDAAELDLDDFFPELLEACKYDGRQVVLPRWFNISLLYYNTTLFDAAGEPYPRPDWTWDDYVAAGIRLTRRGADGRVEVWGSNIMTGWWGEWLIYVRQSGGDLFTTDLNRCLLDTPEAIRGLRFYFDKIHTHGFAPRPGFGPELAFGSGKVAMDWGGHTGLWVSYNQIPSLDWDVQILPSGPATRRGGEFAIDTFGVSKDSPRREAAWEFIKFLVSKPSIRRHVQEGYLSVRKSVADELLFAPTRDARPRNVRAAYEQLKHAVQLPRSPDYIELALEVIQPDIDRMLDKRIDPAATARDATRAANRFIAVLGETRRERDARP